LRLKILSIITPLLNKAILSALPDSITEV